MSGNPGPPWRRPGSRCRATYTRHRCILGEQLGAGEDTACAALPLAEPLPSSKPSLLFHSPTCRPTKPPLPSPRPRRTTNTLSVLVWVPSRFAAQRCGRTGRHSASLRVHCSRSAARFACVSRDEHDRRMTLRRTHVQKYTRAHLVVWERQRESDALCVCGLFWVSVF